MKPVFTFSEIREIEKHIIAEDNFPSIILMENAGKNSFDVLIKEYPNLADYQLYILCGKGNNAGDGYTLARHFLISAIEFSIVKIEKPSSLKGDALIQYEALLKCGLSADSLLSYEEFVSGVKSFQKKSKILIIDAILGTGISGSLSDKYTEVFGYLNNLRKNYKNLQVASLDIPSGLMSGKQINPLVNADITISMGTVKSELLFGEGKENSGRVHVVPIGITDSLIEKYNSFGKYEAEPEDINQMFPKRRKTSYKYSNGKLLVIGGSKGLSGAVMMSSISTVKSGAGGVAAAVPESISRLFSKKLYEIMKVELNENEEGGIRNDSFAQIKKRLKWANAVLLGPGISTGNNTKDFVFDVIVNCDKNLVIDADALTLIASNNEILKKRKHNNIVILTPHIGEFSRLARVEPEELMLNRFEKVRAFALEYNANIVLKSETSLSCLTSGEIFINPTGNESLATAGSGDVLSGIIASLLSQTGDPKIAMVCGNYLHGLCADLYYLKNKNKQTASPQDIINLIPKAVSMIII
jgi:hydroxyethylthiazole kinase-like uncharacterized protein yjeF